MPYGVRVPGDVREEFWALVRARVHPDLAAEQVGVSATAGRRWLADRGGVMQPASRAGRVGCCYHRLTYEQRETIGLMLASGAGDAAVAAAVGCHRATVGRERRRNGTVGGGYRPGAAQTRAEQRASTSHRRAPKLAAPGPLRDYVIEGLKARWSPQEIAYRIRRDHPEEEVMRVCAETIYQALYVQARGTLKRELTSHLRSQRDRRRPRTRSRSEQRRGKLVDTISISQRPGEAADRAVPGHWEGDLIMGRENGSAIGTLVERSTRYVMLIHLPGRHTAQAFHDAIVPTINTLPVQLKRSLTWDNGKEMARHRDITMATGMQVYFADPHSPWQRGSNENTNGLLRQYFPKGISLRQFSPTHLADVAIELNQRPRKTLDWRTPAEALNEILGQPYEPPLLH